MPIFEYRCRKCSHTFEKYSGGDESGGPCPKCGGSDSEKIFSVFSSQCSSPSSTSSGPAGGCGGSGGFT
jgi:putative FmdB family regulatory protein